jgi:hypothetical protein
MSNRRSWEAEGRSSPIRALSERMRDLRDRPEGDSAIGSLMEVRRRRPGSLLRAPVPSYPGPAKIVGGRAIAVLLGPRRPVSDSHPPTTVPSEDTE